MRRRLVGYGVVLLVLVLFPVASVIAQRTPSGSSDSTTRTFTISGQIRNGDNGQAVEMVKVDLKRFTGEVISTAFTRSNGDFEFSGLPRGSYYVVVEEAGFEPIREGVEIINSDRRGVILHLSKPLEFRRTEPGNSVSARELGMPRKAREAFQKGRERLFDKRDSKGSIALFQRAVTEVPTYYEAYHLMGVAYSEMGLVFEAETAYDKAIEVSGSKFAPPHFSLAALLCDLQRFREAETSARRGLEIDTTDWQGHFHLARALLGLNKVNEAEKSLGEAMSRRPEFADFHIVYANIHIRRQEYTALLNDLDEYLRLAPNGSFSANAREMREGIQRRLAEAKATKSAAVPPKP